MHRLIPLCFLISLVLCSCSKDDEPQPVIVKLTTASASGSEDSGTITINMELTGPAPADTQINFALSGDATLNGDYKLTTPSPIIITEGATTGNIKLDIINDDVIEAITIKNNEAVELEKKQIIVELSSATGVNISETEKTFTFDLTDDDDLPETGLKNDLFWTVQDSDDIDKVNLNMYALYDVVVEDNTITSAEFYTEAGDNESGYETFTVLNDAPDSEYYIAIEYFEGSGNADFTFFSFNPSGIIYGYDTFTQPENNGALVVYGPIATKSGSDFSKLADIKPQLLTRTDLKLQKGIIH